MKRIVLKIVSLILAFSIIASMCVFSADVAWDDVYYTEKYPNGDVMEFAPIDGYISVQNPPNFKWGKADYATSYEIMIAEDEEFLNVVYSKSGIAYNYIVPDYTFDAGTAYYWKVRYVTASETSTWSNVRKFKVLDGAVPFNVPSTETLLSRVPKTHPKIWTTKDKLEEFRGYKDISEGSKSIYDLTISEASRFVGENIIESEPEFTLSGNLPVLVEETKAIGSNYAYKNIDRAYVCGFAYLLTGEAKYADFAKRACLEFNNWHIDGYSSPRNNVQITRTIAYKGASVYDWIYDTLSDTEKSEFLTMLKPRMEDITTSNEGIEKYPLNSMGWSAHRYLALSCIAVYGDMPEAETWLERIFQSVCTMYPNWSYQDGGWSQGTAYCWWSTQISNELTEVLAQLNIINLYETAWNKNAFKWNLYQMPYNSNGNFGDGAQQDNDFRWNMVFNNMHEIYFCDDEYNGYRKWIAEKAGGLPRLGFKRMDAYWMAPKYESVKAVPPTALPLAHHFKDVGHVAMLSDIEDPDRIHFTLRGSSYGTAVHSMQEQNAFFISAFGKDLASKSGYYDYYQSEHHANITRQTFSKNTITVGEKGQVADSFLAKAEIMQFVNHLDFDSTTSDGTKAYVEDAFDKFERTILYIRPDIFVVIDELDAKGDNKERFNWWLNSAASITAENNNKHALINIDGANLSARVAYPATNGYYYEGFVNPFTGVTYEPTGRYADMPKHNRKRFETAEVFRTKMVVSMNVFEDGNSEKKPVVSYGPNNSYLKLSYLGGETVVLVNLNQKNVKVTAEAEGIEFTGTAVTYNSDSIMLTDGTYLKKDGKEIVQSADKYITCALGVGEICISSNSDFSTTLGDTSDYLTITGVDSLTNEDGKKLSSKTGVVPSYNTATSSLTLAADKGDWTILTSEESVVNPDQISASTVHFQKSKDNRVAVYWTEKAGRTYDINIDGGVLYNVTSPYVFTINPSEKENLAVSSIFIREKIGNHAGPWSEPVYISSEDPEVHDVVAFNKTQDGEKTFVNASTNDFLSLDVFDMFLANYDANNTLLDVKRATKENNLYTVSVDVAGGVKQKAFLFGSELKPLASASLYGNDDISLRGLYIDNVALEDYSDNIDYYEITIPHNRMLFPYVRAIANDNSTKAEVEYDFDNMKAYVHITSQKGTKRKIELKFLNSRENIHVVVDPATGESPVFVRDVASYPEDISLDEREANVSKTNVATLYFTRTVPAASSEEEDVVTNESLSYPIWTNLKENQGNYRRGSKIFSDRWPGKGNYMELSEVTEDLRGYDYFVFSHDGLFADCRDKGHILSDVKLDFTVNADSDVVVLSKVKADSLINRGWKEEDVSLQARFMNYPGPEDWYYNVVLLGRDKSEMISDPTKANNGMNYRLKNYTLAEEWVDVNGISEIVAGIGNLNTTGYALAVEAYINAGLKKDDFLVTGNCLKYTSTGGYLYQYTYTKEVKKGNVSLSLEQIKGWGDECIVVVRPRIPKPFYFKNDFPVVTEDDFGLVKNNLSWFAEAEDYATAPAGINVYDTRQFLSGGKGVSLFDDYGTKMTWNVTVPETGIYSFVVKYVAWGADGLPIREISFNDSKTYTFTPEKTESYGTTDEEWRACVVDADIFLEKGENMLTIKALNTGMWNIDWVGLLKK